MLAQVLHQPAQFVVAEEGRRAATEMQLLDRLALVDVATDDLDFPLDIRRGDGPKECFNYTMASIAATDKMVREEPEKASAAIRAVTGAQKALAADPSLATSIGKKLFPETEATLIAELIRRDIPFYSPVISEDFVRDMNQFARDIGLLERPVPFEEVVATQFRQLWTA